MAKKKSRSAKPETVDMNMGAIALGQVLVDRDWHQTDMRDAIGSAQGMVSKWIAGKRKPGRLFAGRLQRDFGIPVEWWTVKVDAEGHDRGAKGTSYRSAS